MTRMKRMTIKMKVTTKTKMTMKEMMMTTRKMTIKMRTREMMTVEISKRRRRDTTRRSLSMQRKLNDIDDVWTFRLTNLI